MTNDIYKKTHDLAIDLVVATAPSRRNTYADVSRLVQEIVDEICLFWTESRDRELIELDKLGLTSAQIAQAWGIEQQSVELRIRDLTGSSFQ